MDMDRYDLTGVNIQKIPISEDIKELTEIYSENMQFDASQYDFFGKDIADEVELGGLEEDDNEIPLFGHEDDGLLDREEVGGLGYLGEIDDLTSTFSKKMLWAQSKRNDTLESSSSGNSLEFLARKKSQGVQQQSLIYGQSN